MANATVDPRTHDEAEAKLFEAAERAQRNLDAHTDRMHRMACDKKDWMGSRQVWRMTHAQVLDQLRFLVVKGDERDPRAGMTPSAAMAEEHDLRTELARIEIAINEAEAIYREHRWTRWFPCLNRDGHIHSSLRGCPSVRWDTAMGWTPELSGKSIETAVHELGEALCTICFPAAPVDWTRKTLGQVQSERTRSERDAVKAARDAVKAAKRLRDDEAFRTSYGHDRVTTVAACKDAIRKAVDTEEELKALSTPEFAKTYTGNGGDINRLLTNIQHSLVQQREDAAKATVVLLAREERQAGHGATQAEIDKMIAAKHKAAAKAWAQA